MADKRPEELDFYDLLDLLGSARTYMDGSAPASICEEIDDVLTYYLS